MASLCICMIKWQGPLVKSDEALYHVFNLISHRYKCHKVFWPVFDAFSLFGLVCYFSSLSEEALSVGGRGHLHQVAMPGLALLWRSITVLLGSFSCSGFLLHWFYLCLHRLVCTRY